MYGRMPLRLWSCAFYAATDNQDREPWSDRVASDKKKDVLQGMQNSSTAVLEKMEEAGETWTADKTKAGRTVGGPLLRAIAPRLTQIRASLRPEGIVMSLFVQTAPAQCDVDGVWVFS